MFDDERTNCMKVFGAMKDTVQLAAGKKCMPDTGDCSYPHIAGMLIRMRDESFAYGKMNRWLGWAQCAVVVAGAATRPDMEKINRKWDLD